jgi:hypothetical protein
MPRITYKPNASWHNFHRTLGQMGPEGPEMQIASLASIDATDASQISGLERFATTGATLFEYLRALDVPSAPSEAPASFAAGTVGQGWSFAPLIGTPVTQLDATGLAGLVMLADDERDPGCRLPADFIALAGGGTTVYDLLLWAESNSRTVHTSGTYLFPTVAGAAATASHGSRLGFGGMQNMILGMHLIVGSGEHVWIEPKFAPVLSPAGLERLAIDGTPPQLVQDDDRFEDALVHLGAMGIVNGVAIELTASRNFTLMQRVTMLTPDFLQDIADGKFQAVAARLNCAVAPLFYELTINPHAPFDYPATNILYFPTSRMALMPSGNADILRPADAISQLGDKMHVFGTPAKSESFAPADFTPTSAQSIPPWVLPMLIGDESIFAYYRGLKAYDTPDAVFDPEAQGEGAPKLYKWSELHKGTITGNQPGALYNASFSIPLEHLAKAIPLICAAVHDLAPSFVFTVRFVDKAAGTLAFTRFEKNAVIEIDGLSPLICLGTQARVDRNQHYAPGLIAALDVLAATLPMGAAAVRGALDGAGIRYSMHWAKLGDLHQAKVHADYGHPRDPESLIYRWRQTRDDLLTPFGKRVFWNDALLQYGLLDP